MSHLTIQLPPPPGLQLGLQPGRSRLTEPEMYESRHRPLRSVNLPNPIHREQLPPVSQLLTPSSQSSFPPSPFSPGYRIDLPPSTRPAQSSSSPNWPADRRAEMVSLPYLNGMATPPLTLPQRTLSYPVPTSAPTQLTLRTANHPWRGLGRDGASPPQSSIVQRSRSDPSPYQPTQPAYFVASDQHDFYRTAEPRQRPKDVRSRDGSQAESSTVTQYVPRAVREEVVPGEGPCYVYEDGSHCRKVIDGEMVNANWGVTKAGKPRKRLAVACMTCREKKIKCDPQWPKCLQCDKFARECKFQNA